MINWKGEFQKEKKKKKENNNKTQIRKYFFDILEFSESFSLRKMESERLLAGYISILNETNYAYVKTYGT